MSAPATLRRVQQVLAGGARGELIFLCVRVAGFAGVS
jgi:hypothetical protein